MSQFLWGAATAAFQIEGALNEDGRSPSIWDEHCNIPGRVNNNDKADIACDSYHRFNDDLAALKYLGVNAYRFSLSWPRIQPDGKGAPNRKGLDYYHKIIDTLLANNITPMVTLYHWDLPACLEHSQNGWMNRQTALDFATYAEICFREFGSKVPYWCTINEPWCIAMLGYEYGLFAPAKKIKNGGYISGHNLLLAHAYAVRKYREMGLTAPIGMAINSDWREPLHDTPEDQAAVDRAVQFFYGWFGDPLVRGEYPPEMIRCVGERMPSFTADEKKLLIGSADYMGLNHYTTHQVAAVEPVDSSNDKIYGNGGFNADQQAYFCVDPKWETTSLNFPVYPKGLRKMLEWIAARYPGYPIYITENGCASNDSDETTALQDDQRQRYLKEYTREMMEAKKNGCPIQGYFCWSLEDNFEWNCGYSQKLGLFRCTPDKLERIPKGSAKVYRDIIKQNAHI